MEFLAAEAGVWLPAIAVHFDRPEGGTGVSEWLATADNPPRSARPEKVRARPSKSTYKRFSAL